MDNKEPGYVYILTNPSFKEDWVKIGKTSTSVEQRVKQLDGTAVPLPFEIFAYLKTAKFNEAETLVHHYIGRFTTLRVRDNREFFKVNPNEALDALRDVARLLDDAEIVTYVNGEPVNIEKGDAPSHTDEDSGTKGAASSKTKQQKKLFWEGYINYIKKSGEYIKEFPVHERIPRYSFDLPLGTSACNIFQAIKRGEATVGIYFHGKDLFNSLQTVRDEFEATAGDNTIWEEYDKDCCAKLSYSIDLFDTSKYDACYEWMVKSAVALKKALWGVYDGSKLSDDAVRRAAPFRFSMIGLEIGEEITFVPTGVKVRIASDRKIEYKHTEYSLSAFAAAFMPEEKRNPSNAYCGPEHFTYDGELLSDLRRSKS